MSHDIRKEALINEYKGNLFEFLVAKSLAAHHKIEDKFLGSLNENSFAILSQQEEFIREFSSNLYEFLPTATKETTDSINAYLTDSVESISLVGKYKNQATEYDETDIYVKTKKDNYSLSIKMNKSNSFINTKSAGVKSIFQKYFNEKSIQDEFNKFWEIEFETFAQKMHFHVGLEYTRLFDNWNKERTDLLPGQLNDDLKVLLYEFYEKVNNEFVKMIKTIANKDKLKFTKNLLPLMGFSSQDVIQVCLYHKKLKDNISVDHIHILDKRHLDDLMSEEYILKVNKTNVEIQFNQYRLQLRLKPMNTFTHSAYKINCSIKIN